MATPLTAQTALIRLAAFPGDDFKAAKRENMVWDRMTTDPKNLATVIPVNRGNGFEEALSVPGANGGRMIYFGPFELENEPSTDQLFLFVCSDMIFLRD